MTLEATATCVDANANGDEGDTPGTTTGAAPPPCDNFDSNINVGSIGQVAEAAAGTGLVPDGVNSRAVGQELRRMMEVTGEICQADLLDLVENGNTTPELEDAIKAAVETVQNSG